MYRLTIVVAILALLLFAPVPAPLASAQESPHCPAGQSPRFVLGFEQLEAQLGATMGEPTTCEYPDPNGTGDTLQETTTGLAFWRKSTNIPTFTDGWDHWALTPRDLIHWTGESIDPPGAAAPAPGAPFSESAHPILVLYYPWYDPDSFGSNTAFQPVSQNYHSDDPVLIEQHVQWARRAGIDAFVVAWEGAGSRTDRNLRKVLDIGARHGLRATIYFETHVFVPFGPEDVAAQLKAFYANYVDRGEPNLVRFQGKPVIFFWATRLLSPDAWASIRAQVDPQRRAVWIAEGDVYAQLAGDTFDGLHLYSIAWSDNPARTLANAGARVHAFPNTLWIPTAMPGYDDTRDPHKLLRGDPTFVRERDNGAYLRESFRGAVVSSPDWAILITSFNEWLEGHQIEPAEEYGTTYLDRLRELVDEYRSGR